MSITSTGSAILSSVTDHQDGTYRATISNTIAEMVRISAGFGGVTNTVDVNFVYVSQTINFNGLDYKTLQSPDTGRIWLDRHLGCCTSSHLKYRQCYLYQWGRDDGYERRTSGTTNTQASDVVNVGHSLFITDSTSGEDWASVDTNGSIRANAWEYGGSNDICPAGFGVPTKAELMADTTQATTVKITINPAQKYRSIHAA